jgi:SAM-dependent methyltransferase
MVIVRNPMTTLPCPCCGQPSLQPLLDLGNLPLSGIFFIQPPPHPLNASLLLESCPTCSFVRKAKLPGAQRSYEFIDRDTVSQIPAYLDNILNGILFRVSPSSLVVEIGSNDGSFLQILRQKGYHNFIGVEPSQHLAAKATKNGVKTYSTYFNIDTSQTITRAHGKADIIICRHTLEHIPDPLSFLQACKSLLSEDGYIYLECPDSMTLFHQHRIHEIWDEHENYFTRRTMEMILQHSGFGDIHIERSVNRDAINLCVWAKLAPAKKSHFDGDATSDQTDLSLFAKSFADIRAYAEKLVSASPAQIYVIGAGHCQVNYLLYTGIGSCVKALVDDAAWKSGKQTWVPMPCPVISTEQLIKEESSCQILATGFPYPDWMEKIRKARKGRGDIWLEPYPPPQKNLI